MLGKGCRYTIHDKNGLKEFDIYVLKMCFLCFSYKMYANRSKLHDYYKNKLVENQTGFRRGSSGGDKLVFSKFY
jgi:hypothetical protein